MIQRAGGVTPLRRPDGRFTSDPERAGSLTLAERFWSHVDRSGGPDACWPWTGALNKYGYGHFRMNGKIERANRVAVVLGDPEDHVQRPGGRIPPRELDADHLSCHECVTFGVPVDNKACCNPAHLEPGDHSRNNQESYERGRRCGKAARELRA